MSPKSLGEEIDLVLLLGDGETGVGGEIEMLGAAFFGEGDPTPLPGGRLFVLAVTPGVGDVCILRWGGRRIETRGRRRRRGW